MTRIFLKLNEYYESHKEQFDLAIGGGIGAGTGANHYWEHFMQDENLFKLLDGIINTGLHTIVGAVLLWGIHKYILKKNK
jgi:hypothetical protein